MTCGVLPLPLWITSLPSGGYLDLNGTSITSLGNLASVGEYLDLNGTPIASLGNLTSVGGWLDLRGAPITSFGNLTSVGGWLDLQKTPITSLGNLTSVGGDLDLRDTPITSLDDLPQVGRDLLLDKIQFQLLTREVLRKTAGKIKYKDPSKDLLIPLSPSELETIITENEARESLQNTRKTDVDWDLYDR